MSPPLSAKTWQGTYWEERHAVRRADACRHPVPGRSDSGHAFAASAWCRHRYAVAAVGPGPAPMVDRAGPCTLGRTGPCLEGAAPAFRPALRERELALSTTSVA